MSMKAVIGSYSLAFLVISATMPLMAHTVGCSLVFGFINYRFKSLPLREVL
jgi:hypothetical protein